MTSSWLVVILAGVATLLIKGVGPVFLGGRTLPPRLLPVLELLAPALFGALIVTQVFVTGRDLALDARAAGLLAAVIAARLRARPILVLLSAAVVTAIVRAVTQ
jgi:branched chain amino acid efflux pump